MNYIRSIFFWISVYIVTICLVVGYFILSLFIKKNNLADDCAKIWAKAIIFFLGLFCKIKHEIIGIENIPETPVIIACKHQSMWETIIFHLIFKHPVYIYKKELMKIPFYGWYIQQMTSIKVDREGGASALKDMIKQSKKNLANKHNIIIFPQGTRVPFNANSAEFPYQVGIAAIYLGCNNIVVPARLNSGEFWSKSMLIKCNGKITLEFLEPINAGLKKDEFMKILEMKMENKNG